MKKNCLPSLIFVERLQKIQEQLTIYCERFWNEKDCEYNFSLASDANAVIGSIEQFIENYIELANRGLR